MHRDQDEDDDDDDVSASNRMKKAPPQPRVSLIFFPIFCLVYVGSYKIILSKWLYIALYFGLMYLLYLTVLSRV